MDAFLMKLTKLLKWTFRAENLVSTQLSHLTQSTAMIGLDEKANEGKILKFHTKTVASFRKKKFLLTIKQN